MANTAKCLIRTFFPGDSIGAAACLILLGEPGVGKSTTMKEEYERTAESCLSVGDQVVWVDLRTYQTDQRLHDGVFASPAVKAWPQGRLDSTCSTTALTKH